MPLLAGYFFYSKRRTIFTHVEYSLGAGATLIGVGVILAIVSSMLAIRFDENDRLSLQTFSTLLVLTGAFVWFYGLQALKKAAFPTLMLLLMIPIPTFLAQGIMELLRRLSAEVVYGVLSLLGLPVSRDGYVFHFPQLSIRITEQCSGIRSFLAVTLTSLIAGNLFLRRGWARVLLVIAVIPITILKNAFRIVVISIIAVYASEKVFQSAFHRLVGLNILSLVLLWVAITLLRRLETKTHHDGGARSCNIAGR